MNKKLFLLGFLLLCYACLVAMSILFEGVYYFDLLSSLLPYWLVINTISLLGILLLVWHRANTSAVLFLKATSLLIFLITLVLSFKFYNFTYSKQTVGTGSQDVTIAFFNKLYSNTNYSEIDSKVKVLKPDLLGFSEIKDLDKVELPILATYTCSLSKEARDGATISFYSNYPCHLNEAAPPLPFVLPVSVNIFGKEYSVFVVHPVPPMTQAWMKQRDREMLSLSSYINSLPTEDVIILGDFNMSPWSRSFAKIAASLDTLKNSALGMGLNFTWHGKMLNTQVDHIFVPQYAFVKLFRSEIVEGSDHNLIWTKISL